MESDTICTVILKAAIDPEGIAVLATASKVKDVVTMTDTDVGNEGDVHCSFLSFDTSIQSWGTDRCKPDRHIFGYSLITEICPICLSSRHAHKLDER